MNKQIEEDFAMLTRLLLGKSLGQLKEYEGWLQEHRREIPSHKSAVGERMIFDPPLIFYKHIAGRGVKPDEALRLGGKDIGNEQARRLDFTNAASLLASIAYFTTENTYGTNVEVEECSLYGNSSYCYQVHSFVNCKHCAHSFWPRDSEYLFGVDTVFSSKFCLKCYNSVNLTRCFEVSHSSNSSDCYFCHNLDACSECLFCTNSKSLRYAVFNHEVGKEEYLCVKKLVLEEVSRRLEKDKRLGLNIFNVGCSK